MKSFNRNHHQSLEITWTEKPLLPEITGNHWKTPCVCWEGVYWTPLTEIAALVVTWCSLPCVCWEGVCVRWCCWRSSTFSDLCCCWRSISLGFSHLKPLVRLSRCHFTIGGIPNSECAGWEFTKGLFFFFQAIQFHGNCISISFPFSGTNRTTIRIGLAQFQVLGLFQSQF